MHANLELTRLCNQQCVYCFNDSGPDPVKARAAIDWSGAISTLGELGFRSVHFTGGEPFLVRNLLELMRIALDRGLKISVLSNGYDVSRLLKRVEWRLVLARLQLAQISLDSMDRDLHDLRRGKSGAWNVAVGAIKSLSQAQVPTEVSCVVDEQNEAGISAVAKFAQRHRARLILRPRVPLGRAAGSPRYTPGGTLRTALQRFADVLIDDRFHYVPTDQVDRTIPRGIITVTAAGTISGDLSLVPPRARLDIEGRLLAS